MDRIDNPYFPLVPGTRWIYEGTVDGQQERIELEVTTETKVILGISAVGVSDTNYVEGELAAQTMDWYAQDSLGNVWYLAEVVGREETHSIGLGDYSDLIVILGWTPLEPGIIEEKYYAPGVGKIYEVITAGGEGGTELVEHNASP